MQTGEKAAEMRPFLLPSQSPVNRVDFAASHLVLDQLGDRDLIGRQLWLALLVTNVGARRRQDVHAM